MKFGCRKVKVWARKFLQKNIFWKCWQRHFIHCTSSPPQRGGLIVSRWKNTCLHYIAPHRSLLKALFGPFSLLSNLRVVSTFSSFNPNYQFSSHLRNCTGKEQDRGSGSWIFSHVLTQIIVAASSHLGKCTGKRIWKFQVWGQAANSPRHLLPSKNQLIGWIIEASDFCKQTPLKQKSSHHWVESLNFSGSN